MPENSAATAPGYAERSMELLTEVREAGLREGLVDTALARLATKMRPDDVLWLADSALAQADLTGRARADAMSLRADALARQGDYQPAIATLRDLTHLRRGAVDWLALANCLSAQGNSDAATGAFETAVRINPRLGKVHRHLADYYRRLGDTAKTAWHEQRSGP